jgi:hypothetical protein
LWIQEKGIALFCRFKERCCLVKKRIRGSKKIGMPVKWLEAEIDKSFIKHSWWNLPNKAAA